MSSHSIIFKEPFASTYKVMWPHEVILKRISYSKRMEIYNWLSEEIEDAGFEKYYCYVEQGPKDEGSCLYVWFHRNSDAIQFKLRWG